MTIRTNIALFARNGTLSDHAKLAYALIVGLGAIYWFWYVGDVMTARLPASMRLSILALLTAGGAFVLFTDIIYRGIIVPTTERIRVEIRDV